MNVYFDVDDVISNWRKGYSRAFGHVWSFPRGEWVELDVWDKPMDQLVHMYETLPLLDPSGKLFLDAVQANGWSLLTAIPDDMPLIQQARLKWLEALGYGDVECIFSCYKETWAHGRSVLIDDRLETIYQWEDAGGKGIHFHAGIDSPHSAQEVLELINMMPRWLG